MLKKLIVSVVLAVTASLTVVVGSAPATADVPRPIYKCTKPNVTGQWTVAEPTDCRGGHVKIYSTYDGKLHGEIDMWKLEARIEGGSSLAQIEQACRDFIVCDLIYGALVWAGLGRAYRLLKAIL